MDKVKGFLFANVPLSVAHFILLLLCRSNGWREAGGVIGQPGYWLAGTLGAAGGGVLFWIIMAISSLVWGAVLSLVVFPLLGRIAK